MTVYELDSRQVSPDAWAVFTWDKSIGENDPEPQFEVKIQANDGRVIWSQVFYSGVNAWSAYCHPFANPEVPALV